MPAPVAEPCSERLSLRPGWFETFRRLLSVRFFHFQREIRSRRRPGRSDGASVRPGGAFPTVRPGIDSGRFDVRCDFSAPPARFVFSGFCGRRLAASGVDEDVADDIRVFSALPPVRRRRRTVSG